MNITQAAVEKKKDKNGPNARMMAQNSH